MTIHGGSVGRSVEGRRRRDEAKGARGRDRPRQNIDNAGEEVEGQEAHLRSASLFKVELEERWSGGRAKSLAFLASVMGPCPEKGIP